MTRLIRLLPIAAGLLGAAAFVACTSDVTAPDSSELAKDAVSYSEFTRCRPQPYASGSAWIGASGGTVKAGKHVLKIPAGALSGATLITMESPPDSINRVRFGPEGLTFNAAHSPRLVMSYKNCSVRPGTKQRIVYVNDSLSIIEGTPSDSDTLSLTVEGRLRHFSEYVIQSTYAVAY